MGCYCNYTTIVGLTKTNTSELVAIMDQSIGNNCLPSRRKSCEDDFPENVPKDEAVLESSSTCMKRFIFQSSPNAKPSDSQDHGRRDEVLEIFIPERMEASYGLYVWPCAPILAWYLYEHREYIRGKKVLELGAGTALPGILCALCGAEVTLSDSGKLPHCLEQSRKSIEANGLKGKVNVIGLTWGLFLHDLINLRGKYDIILGSDCFYDPSVFEDLLLTIAYLFGNNRNAKFLGTYQERSSDWSIDYLLTKWGLQCRHIPLNDLARSAQVDIVQLMQDHTIHLLEISLLPESA